jgi:DNA transposition AAA+ family ATPase
MSQTPQESNIVNSLYVVVAAIATMRQIVERPLGLPGLAVFYGFSGFGKTFAASKLVNMFNAIHVEAKSFWTRKQVLEEILHCMGLPVENTVAKMFTAVCKELADTGRPLIVDEMDHLADKGVVEIVRDIHDRTDAPIMLIGEERLPAKLARWERVHSRIMVWSAAPPANIDDAKDLAGHYAAGIEIRDDLLQLIVDKAHGSVRRICVNLDRAKSEAISRGITSIGLKEWDKGEIYTGEAPPPRRQP